MKSMKQAAISWEAPIMPSISLAGIEVGRDAGEFEALLSKYAVDEQNGLYQFDMSPLLRLTKSLSNGDESYLFSVHDRDLTNWRLFFNTPDHAGADPRALGVVVRHGKVFFVRAWHFEKLREGDKPKNIYRGKLPEGLGLGDLVSELLPYAGLTYDEDEELFYADSEYGALEVTGYGELDDYPDQVIMSITVIAESAD